MKYISTSNDWIDKPHFVIIEFDSINIPGDERSRTNPGHGYPEHTKSVVNYIAFESEEEWKREIKSRMESKYSNIKAIKVAPAVITTSVNVEIN